VNDLAGFTVAVLAILLTPGPTNSLLAAAGATNGWRRSLVLVPAEISGYVISITTLTLLAAPLVAASSLVATALKLACGSYLGYAAWRLWSSKLSPVDNRHIRFRDVFITTLLNPKGLLFAFGIFPAFGPDNSGLIASRLSIFAAICVFVANVWIVFGALLRSRGISHVTPVVYLKVAAAVLAFFAVLLLGAAIEGAVSQYAPGTAGS
jgi:threonine/homoserine/homoserine lactone efflux protein